MKSSLENDPILRVLLMVFCKLLEGAANQAQKAAEQALSQGDAELAVDLTNEAQKLMAMATDWKVPDDGPRKP